MQYIEPHPTPPPKKIQEGKKINFFTKENEYLVICY